MSRAPMLVFSDTSHESKRNVRWLPVGEDIGVELFRQGLALDFSMFSGGKYRQVGQAGVRVKLESSKPVSRERLEAHREKGGG